MKKIKIVGTIIFILSITLAIVSFYISDQNKINSGFLETINKQKAFTQEISKNIFYIYKNKNKNIKQLDQSIKDFLENMNQRDDTLKELKSPLIKKQSDKIVILWNKFYLDVQKFRNQHKTISTYTNILLEKTVKDIYNTNLQLIIEFDKFIVIHQNFILNKSYIYKNIQYSLFLIFLIFLGFFLIYIFKATSNIDFLIKKINSTVKSIDQIENNAEIILDSISQNDELIKKEDAVIESLEELINSQIKLKNLQVDLENLIKLKN